MAQGLKVFRDVRINHEVTTGNGTKEASSAQRIFGNFSCPMGGKILHRPDEGYGSLGVPRRTVVVGEKLEMTFEGDCLFDQMHFVGQSIVYDQAPAGAAGAYIWQFKHNLTTATAPKSKTIFFGDNLEQWSLEFCIAREIQLTYAMDEPVRLRETYFGRNFEESSWSPPTQTSMTTVETALSNKTIIASAAVGGAVGTHTATLLSGTLTMDTGYRPIKYGSTLNYFDDIMQVEPKLTFAARLLWNTDVEAMRGYYAAGTNRMWQITTPGTSNRNMQHSFNGVITDFGAITDVEGGNATVDVTIEAQYYSAYIYYMTITNKQANLATINP